jgi:putative FmdB family regulatory protein
MPIYEYKCEKGHVFEVTQRMADDPITVCTTCGAPVQRVFHPIAIHFKGSGFHNTDYGTKKRNRELKESAEKGADANDAKVKASSAEKSGKKTESSAGTSDSSSSSSSSKDSSSGGSSKKPAK